MLIKHRLKKIEKAMEKYRGIVYNPSIQDLDLINHLFLSEEKTDSELRNVWIQKVKEYGGSYQKAQDYFIKATTKKLKEFFE